MYGVLIALAILTASFIGEKLAKKKNYDLNLYWTIAFWSLIGGVLGARLYHVIDKWAYYSKDFIQIVELWKGGLGILGAVLGGIIAVLLVLLIKKQANSDKLKWLDIAAVVLPLAQAIGRWGNFFNKELFGTPTSLPWGINIPMQLRPEKYFLYDTFHPLFLYESFLDFLLFIVLYKSYEYCGKNEKSGNILSLYLMGYGSIRIFMEFLRVDPWMVNGLNVGQIVSILMIITGFTLRLHKSKKE
jgi:phosphatidylglycerol---prolipoprotein diacylglyceryl transferase